MLDDSAVAILAGTNLMDEYYGSGGVTSLEIPDGSNVTAPGLKKIISTMFRPHGGVHAVIVGHAGLAFTSDVAKEVVRATSEDHSYLEVLSLSGAFLLQDEDISSILSTNASTLISLTLTSCPTMASSTCSELFSLTNLSELSLQHCPLSRDQLNSISWGAMSGLRR